MTMNEIAITKQLTVACDSKRIELSPTMTPRSGLVTSIIELV
jgi:hypothetical protein